MKGPDGIRIQVQLEPDSAESSQASALPASPKEGSETIRFTGCSDAAGGDRGYWIGTDDSVGVQAAEEAKPADAVVSFSTVEQLRRETSSWQTPQFVRVWNKLPGARPVSRFENRTIAVDRLWRALQDLHQRREKGGAAKTEKKAKTKKKKRGGQSKADCVLGLLRRPGGATLSVLMEATGWQAHSVRGFLSGKLSKQLGLPVESWRQDGERVYALSSVGVTGETADELTQPLRVWLQTGGNRVNGNLDLEGTSHLRASVGAGEAEPGCTSREGSFPADA